MKNYLLFIFIIAISFGLNTQTVPNLPIQFSAGTAEVWNVAIYFL